MVNGSVVLDLPKEGIQDVEIAESPVKYCTVTLSDVISRGKRLEASVFDVESMHAHQMIQDGKYSAIPLIGTSSPVVRAYYGARIKRNYVEPTYPNAVGFVGSSEMLDCYPRPVKFMEDSERTKDLHVHYGDILISRSGTIGNLTFVSKTLEKLLVSEHAIRMECRGFPGYVYAYLRSKTGQLLIRSNVYGAVIQEIEPEHLATIPIPDAPWTIKKRINDLIVGSYELRDVSNALIDKATELLVKELQFPDIRDFNVSLYKKNAGVDTFSVKLSDLAGRVDASYHVPIVDAIVDHMKHYAADVTTIGDSKISKEIILPGRFKRVYVEEGYGKVFIGGKQLYELDPTNKKYLSIKHHADRIAKQLTLHEGMTLITCSGTIGKVALVGRHWENWTASQHIIRVVPSSMDMAGYISVFLASDYGYPLITHYTYGSVVDEIDDNHVASIPFPLLKNTVVQKQINDLALEANEKRYQAYKLEQQALQIIDKDVIFANKNDVKNYSYDYSSYPTSMVEEEPVAYGKKEKSDV